MKKTLILGLMLSLTMAAGAVQNEKYLNYIAQWRDVAVQHQKEYGIPAAITLAQGLLESGAGQSELAVKANNHFGIKCTSEWMGDVFRYSDNRRNECFRRYNNAEESFRDHAKFLQKPRYEKLFSLKVTDYKGWAQGLKDCGYATDPAYPQKLIRIIEDYELADLGKGAAGKPETGKKADEVVVLEQTEPIATINADPEPPYVRPLSAKEEKAEFFAHHGRGKCNGVKYTVAREGDTYSSIAFSLNIPERSLREMNDALGRTLQKDDRVYLGKKKAQAAPGHERIWVKPGESVWHVIQKEGITEASFRALNGLPVDVRVFKTRQQVLLRKEKK